MDIATALLDSWDRQCRIVNAVASRIDESNRHVKPSEDGWSLDHQLAHIHEVRQYWLSQVSPEKAAALDSSFQKPWVEPITDLEKIKSLLQDSGLAIREAMEVAFQGDGSAIGGYDNPVLFLQHMVWHDGWHIGLIFLGLRLAGQEPNEEWEEANVWGEWRTEEF
ncbi:MAG: DinB family protein [Armatimonadetes bacterium]|nr:DinB family protein [Armatimonadota bacterium]